MKAGFTLLMAGALPFFCLILLIGGCSESSDADKGPTGINTSLLIEPNRAVGPIRTGMNVEQVIAALGEPQTRTSNSLEYTRLGLAVMPGPDGIVNVVMCGDVTGINGPFVAKFAGHTQESIGMHSTREQVIQALGEPTADEHLRGGIESMQYKALGMTLTLETGQVYHIIVRLRGSQPTNATVTLEPAPEPPATKP